MKIVCAENRTIVANRLVVLEEILFAVGLEFLTEKLPC